MSFTLVVCEYTIFMQNIMLTLEQVSILKKMHRSTKDRKKADRIKTVLFLHRGFSMKETGELLMLDEWTIAIIRDRFLHDGIDEFLKDSYVLYCGKLTQEQRELVRIFVRENLVLESKMVIDFIEKQWGIIYSHSGIANLLHSLNFTYKKTKLVPSKASIIKQTIHLYRYKTLHVLLAPDEIIFFVDGVHPLHNAISSHGWIEIGTEKLIKANSGRDRVNLNWAYSVDTQEVITHESTSINAQSTIEFYKKIEAAHPEKRTIYIVRDNARYYANKDVQKYLETSRIIEIPLPPYSPNLNPIERLWLFMKKNLLYSHYYEHFSDFKEVIRKFFHEDFHLYQERLKTFITDNFHVLAF